MFGGKGNDLFIVGTGDRKFIHTGGGNDIIVIGCGTGKVFIDDFNL